MKISGMVDESMDKDQLASAPQPWEYRSKPAWQRFFIIIGGVTMNILLAFFIYVGISMTWGESYISNSEVRQGYAFNELAQQAGFENGDRIVSIGNENIEKFNQIPAALIFGPERTVVVERVDSVGGVAHQQTITLSDSMITRMLNSRDFIGLRVPFVIGDVVTGSSAERAGLLSGDSLVGVDGVPLIYFDQFRDVFAATQVGDTLDLMIARANSDSVLALSTVMGENHTIGVQLKNNLASTYKIHTADYTFWQAIPAGYHRAIAQIDNYFKQLKLIFSPDTQAYKEVGGVITMGRIFPGEWDWFSFWNITALLSIMLAVINILPIPALDGGHLVFIIYEMITKRAPSQRFMEYAQYVGFILLVALMIFANGNDILKLFR